MGGREHERERVERKKKKDWENQKKCRRGGRGRAPRSHYFFAKLPVSPGGRGTPAHSRTHRGSLCSQKHSQPAPCMERRGTGPARVCGAPLPSFGASGLSARAPGMRSPLTPSPPARHTLSSLFSFLNGHGQRQVHPHAGGVRRVSEEIERRGGRGGAGRQMRVGGGGARPQLPRPSPLPSPSPRARAESGQGAGRGAAAALFRPPLRFRDRQGMGKHLPALTRRPGA